MSLAEWKVQIERTRGLAIDWSLARCQDGAATMTSLFFSEQIDDIRPGQADLRAVPGAGAVPRGRHRTA